MGEVDNNERYLAWVGDVDEKLLDRRSRTTGYVYRSDELLGKLIGRRQVTQTSEVQWCGRQSGTRHVHAMAVGQAR